MGDSIDNIKNARLISSLYNSSVSAHLLAVIACVVLVVGDPLTYLPPLFLFVVSLVPEILYGLPTNEHIRVKSQEKTENVSAEPHIQPSPVHLMLDKEEQLCDDSTGATEDCE